MKSLLKELILEFQKEDLPVFFMRQVVIPHLPKTVRKALVYIGMRRVGKTYLMYQHMQTVLQKSNDKKKMLYLNFEDDRLEGFSSSNFQTILDVYFELYPELSKAEDLEFYFDEIQNITGWEKFIRRLLDKEKMAIFITGSSAKLLSKEIATSLRGRSLTQEIFPLSFKEYLSYQHITETQNLTRKEKSRIKHYCKIYLKRGGFPETLSTSDSLHHQIIQSYINTAVFRDVIERHNLTTPHIVKLFLTHCLQNITSSLSITKVYKTFKSRGEMLSRSSLYAYLSYFEDAYLIFSVPIFDFSTRKRQVNPSKIYCTDSGIIEAYSIKKEMEQSTCLENSVYVHLRKQNFENIYYYKTASGKEVDFVCQQTNGSLSLFQACLDLNNEKTKQREVDALIEALHELNLSHATIITEDENEILKFNEISIEVIPYWEWALNNFKHT